MKLMFFVEKHRCSLRKMCFPSLVCSSLLSETVLVVDITWNILSMDFVNLMRSTNIPYVHVDVSIRPFVRAFIKFIQYTDTRDVAMIFQNEKGETNAFMEVF